MGRLKTNIIRYCLLSVVVSIFIVYDIFYGSSASMYVFFQTFLVFFIEDTILLLITLNPHLIRKCRILVFTGLITAVLYYLLALPYRGGVYFISATLVYSYPLIFFILNFTLLRKTNYSRIPLAITITTNALFMAVAIGFAQADQNIELYFYLVFLQGIVSYLFFTSFSIKLSSILEIFWDNQPYLQVLFVWLVLLLLNVRYELVVFILFNFVLVSGAQKVVAFDKQLHDEQIADETEILTRIRQKKLDYQLEEIHNSKVAEFLHDEVLQDIIFLKKDVTENYGFSESHHVVNVLEKMIVNVRGQMNLYKPRINRRISLGENYYALIEYLKKRHDGLHILIDFTCDPKLFIPQPYDIIIYRALHELVTNVYKHSLGNYTEINLKEKHQIIYIDVTNYGDFFSAEAESVKQGSGIRWLQGQLQSMGGSISIQSIVENLEDDRECDENRVVKITVELPIEGVYVYEDISNR